MINRQEKGPTIGWVLLLLRCHHRNLSRRSRSHPLPWTQRGIATWWCLCTWGSSSSRSRHRRLRSIPTRSRPALLSTACRNARCRPSSLAAPASSPSSPSSSSSASSSPGPAPWPPSSPLPPPPTSAPPTDPSPGGKTTLWLRPRPSPPGTAPSSSAPSAGPTYPSWTTGSSASPGRNARTRWSSSQRTTPRCMRSTGGGLATPSLSRPLPTPRPPISLDLRCSSGCLTVASTDRVSNYSTLLMLLQCYWGLSCSTGVLQFYIPQASPFATYSGVGIQCDVQWCGYGVVVGSFPLSEGQTRRLLHRWYGCCKCCAMLAVRGKRGKVRIFVADQIT